MLLLNAILLLTLTPAIWAGVAKNSAPFDPFRLECPFYHGLVKLELRRVESSEGVRTDTMITSYCENVKKLHPSPRDRTAAPNDENCRWTAVVNIPGKSIDPSEICTGKEFVAGVARQDLGEYNILCCKLRDRKRGACVVATFPWPTSDAPQTLVEHGKRLMSSVGFKNGQLIGQFCDYTVMSRQELDKEFLLSQQSSTNAQLESNQSGRQNNNSKSGNVQQKIPGRLSEVELPPPRPSPQAPRPQPTANQRSDERNPTTTPRPQTKPPTTTPPTRGQPPRIPTTTPATYEYEYGDEETTQETLEHVTATSIRAGNGVVRVIKDRQDTEEEDSKTTTRVTTSTRVTTPRTSSTTSRRTTTRTTTQAATTASSEEQTEDSGEVTARSKLGPRKPSTVDPTEETPEPEEYVDEEAQRETTEAHPPSATPSPTKGRRTTTVDVPITTTEEAPSHFGATQPDPSRFQILGIPKTPKPDKTRPKAHFLQPPTEVPKGNRKRTRTTRKPSTTSTTVEPEEYEDESTTLTTLAPAPAVNKDGGNGGEGSGDILEMENEGSSAIFIPTTTETAEITTESIELASPLIPSGNVSVDRAQSDIIANNETVESAVAPQSPQFGGDKIPLGPVWKIKPLSTVKWSSRPTNVDDGQNTTSVGTTSAASSDGGAAELTTSTASSTVEDKDGSTSAIVDETEKIQCDTRHASIDNSTSLVIACGQGKDIWSPPRCPEDTFCLLARDSVFRICCPVRVIKLS